MPKLAACLLLAACTTTAGCGIVEEIVQPTTRGVPAPPSAVPTPATPPAASRTAFDIEADKLDTWNAVGQILVRTPGVTYEGRAQMLDMYSIVYRGQALLVFTRALPLSDTIRRSTTQVSATPREGTIVDHDAARALLALLEPELPAEIEDVRRRQGSSH